MKRTALKRSWRPRRGDLEAAEARVWHSNVVRMGCVMCREFPVIAALRAGRQVEIRNAQAHHVVGQRHLKQERLDALLWKAENGICLCEYHHRRHESAVQRVPRRLLPQPALNFAEANGLGWVIDREYAT